SMSKATVLFELQPTSIRHRPGSHPDAPPKRVERVALPPILLNPIERVWQDWKLDFQGENFETLGHLRAAIREVMWVSDP
ncbi:hypothetical protein, partial [Phormidesmis priestleyi]